MAEFRGLNKVPRGSAGGWTFTEILGKGVVKSKVTQVNDAKSDAQIRQRTKIKGLGLYSQQVLGLTETTLKKIAASRRKYHHNIFVSENKDRVSSTDGKLIDSELPTLYLSGGSGELIKSPVAKPTPTGVIGITYSNTGYLPTTPLTTNILYAVYNKSQDYIYWGNPGKTLADGSFQIQGVGDKDDEVFVYVMAFNTESKKGSATQYVGKHTLV
jgi:hypothetical protein